MSEKKHKAGDIFIRNAVAGEKGKHNISILSNDGTYIILLGCGSGIIEKSDIKISYASTTHAHYKFIGNIEDIPKIAEELGVFK